MRNKRIRLIISFIITLILFPLAVEAAKGGDLPSGVLIGDDAGFRVEKDGYYMIEEKDLYPGKTFTRNISIGNYSETLKKPIKIDMGIDYDKRKPIIVGEENLLEVIQVTYKVNGKVIYEGSLDGSGKNNDHKKEELISLGSFSQGETSLLTAEFHVPEDVDKTKWEKENSVEYVNVFYVHRHEDDIANEDEEKKRGILPNTGEELAVFLLGIALGFFIIILIIRTFVNRRRSDSRN